MDLDGLRLIALGRIPRCADCPRYRALVRTHDGRRLPGTFLPAVPEGCTHQVCEPLVHRLNAPAPPEGRLAASA